MHAVREAVLKAGREGGPARGLRAVLLAVRVRGKPADRAWGRECAGPTMMR